jgi:hypothetical protein
VPLVIAQPDAAPIAASDPTATNTRGCLGEDDGGPGCGGTVEEHRTGIKPRCAAAASAQNPGIGCLTCMCNGPLSAAAIPLSRKGTGFWQMATAHMLLHVDIVTIKYNERINVPCVSL